EGGREVAHLASPLRVGRLDQTAVVKMLEKVELRRARPAAAKTLSCQQLFVPLLHPYGHPRGPPVAHLEIGCWTCRHNFPPLPSLGCNRFPIVSNFVAARAL